MVVVRKKRTVLFFTLASGMLVYAVPRLPIGRGWTEETIFGVAWLCVAMLIIAAHLHELIGVNQRVEQDIQAIKRYKYWRLQQKILESSRRDRASQGVPR